VGAQARDGGVGVLAGQLELDVAVELIEADVTAHLRLAGPQDSFRFGCVSERLVP
jgi:hypothetical protein